MQENILAMEETKMKLKDTLGKQFLIVRELDQQTGEMGKPVEIVEIEKDIKDLEELSENLDNGALFYALYKLSLAENICEWGDLRKRYPVGKYGVENCSTSDLERWGNLREYNLPEIKKVKASDYLPNLSNDVIKQMMLRGFTF